MLANVGTPTSWPKHQPNVPDDVEREQTALASSFTHLHKLSVASCIALQKKGSREGVGGEAFRRRGAEAAFHY